MGDVLSFRRVPIRDCEQNSASVIRGAPGAMGEAGLVARITTRNRFKISAYRRLSAHPINAAAIRSAFAITSPFVPPCELPKASSVLAGGVAGGGGGLHGIIPIGALFALTGRPLFAHVCTRCVLLCADHPLYTVCTNCTLYTSIGVERAVCADGVDKGTCRRHGGRACKATSCSRWRWRCSMGNTSQNPSGSFPGDVAAYW